MTLVHILTQGFATLNGRAFLAPIILHKQAIRSLGIQFRIFLDVEDALTDCDVLIVESKYYRPTNMAPLDPVLDQLDALRDKVGKLYYFDTTDSTGNLRTEVLPHVDRYYKGQLLKNRSLYKQSWYGGRIYTDYYHRTHGIEDEEPIYSKPAASDDDLEKLGVSWNPALGDYSHSLTGDILSRIFRWMRWQPFGQLPQRWVAPSPSREVDVSSRFGAGYNRATIRYQRERIHQLLKGRIQTNKLARRAYFREMEHSKIVIAPFGWGEFSYRDFEGFLSGCLVVKPDMSHMETWPDLYKDRVTVLFHDWDAEGLIELLERVTSNYQYFLPIAINGQQTYRDYLVGEHGAEMFARRLASVVQLG